MTDYYEYTIPQLVKLLGARFKDYRLRSNMTQKEVSEQSGLTITTIHKFESGAADNISLATFLLLLKAIGEIEALDDLLAGAAALALPDQEGKESATHQT